jgi:uncharacterized damage-inducible protein DinB
MTLERVRLMFEYEQWANRRVLESLQKASERGEGVRLLAHLLAAQEVWLTRLDGRDTSHIAIFPERSLEECAAELDRLAGVIGAYLGSLEEDNLGEEIAYRNQSGREFRNTPLDILTHLGLHSQHHRGQIALELRRLGQEPAVTDFIVFRRL